MQVMLAKDSGNQKLYLRIGSKTKGVRKKNPWDLFASEQEWALAMWLRKNVGQKSTDEFLKLPIVSKL